MGYNPSTDFLALLRSTTGGVRSARMPGLDFVIEAFLRAGMIAVSVSQTAPTINQAQTMWFKPSVPSWSGEGTVLLWNTTLLVYQTATPALWSQFLSGAAPTTAIPLVDATPAQVGVATTFARADHQHPTDTSRAPLASPVFTGTPQAPTPATADNSNNLATTAFVQNAVQTVVPIGGVVAFIGSAVPNNFAFLNGQAISRTTFATLFGLAGVGITYGSGDGVTTFNLPDLRGRVIAHVDGGANRLTAATMSTQALAGTGGAETHALTIGELAVHTHSPVDPGHIHTASPAVQQFNTTVGVSAAAGFTVPQAISQTVSVASNVTGFTVANNGSGTAHINVQPTMELNYAVRIA